MLVPTGEAAMSPAEKDLEDWASTVRTAVTIEYYLIECQPRQIFFIYLTRLVCSGARHGLHLRLD